MTHLNDGCHNGRFDPTHHGQQCHLDINKRNIVPHGEKRGNRRVYMIETPLSFASPVGPSTPQSSNLGPSSTNPVTVHAM